MESWNIGGNKMKTPFDNLKTHINPLFQYANTPIGAKPLRSYNIREIRHKISILNTDSVNAHRDIRRAV